MFPTKAGPLLPILLLLFSAQALAQTIPVTIHAVDPKKEPIAFASITARDTEDSAASFRVVADSGGRAQLQLQEGKMYHVSLSAVGYEPAAQTLRARSHAVYNLVATPVAGALNAVTVRAGRPLMRQEDDKTIIDPEPMAAASTNAFEMMEKTPGLFIDQDGNIYLNSTTPATVYINGREQKMSAADMATMLKNLPPNAIASIEVLRTPSARYDASGSGGIVNIVLKKGVRIGLTGSVTAGMQQGHYGNQFIGLNLNQNSGALTWYLNVNTGRRRSFENLHTDRRYISDSLLSQDAFTLYRGNNIFFGYGLSYEWHPKWELSYDGRLSTNGSGSRSSNTSAISHYATGATGLQRTTAVANEGSNKSLSQGLHLKHKIDSAGSEWTTDLSFTVTPNRSSQDFTGGEGSIKNRLQFYAAQSHYIRKLPHRFTFEGGLKSSHVSFRNETEYFRVTGGNRIPDAVRSGAYSYREQIHAAYLQVSKTLGPIVIKAGTRMEHTRMNGTQVLPKDTSFSVQRTDLFPYVYLSRNIMKIAGYDLRAYLVYRRTISRPAYEYLNPSLRFIDPYLFETGNPSLRPQFTTNYEANISVDERPVFAVGINETKDIFNQVLYPTDTSKQVSVRTYDNLGRNRETYFRVLGAIPPGRRYFFVAGAQYNHNFYQGLYENKPLSYKRGSWSLFTYHSFRVTPLTQLSLNGFVRFNGQQQFYELETFGSLNLQLTQQLFNRRLSVTISGNDLLLTNRNGFRILQGSIDAAGYRHGDTRRFGMNIRYHFGMRKKEEQHVFQMESSERAAQ